MTTTQSSLDATDGGWDTMEDAGMVVTDIGVLSKREKAGSEYTVVSYFRLSQP